MRTQTIVTGLLLIALGVISYALGGAYKSPTAFIPSIFGIFIVACGLAASNPARTKMAMHAAAGIALLGALGSLFGKSGLSVPNWISTLQGQNATPLAAIAQMLLFAICLVYLALCIKWFLSNRRTRRAA